MRRGLALRCPNCGKGRLFRSYLKAAPSCPACGEALGHIRSDDAAPWLTILVVGHIFVPLMIGVEGSYDVPTWVSIWLWPIIGAALCAIALPFAKGLFIAVIWMTGAPGSERDRAPDSGPAAS